MKPTIIGGTVAATPPRSSMPTAAPAPASPPMPVPLDTGAVVLRPEQVSDAEAAVAGTDVATMPPGAVIRLGLEAEQALQRTLDGFLARLDKTQAAKVFALFGRLEKGVEDAKLPEVLDRIQNGEKPGLIGSLLGRFRGKRPDELAGEVMAAIGDLVAGRTRTLADEMTRIEGELAGEMQRLFGELQALDALKQSYARHFGEFTVAAAVAHALHAKARAVLADEQAKTNAADPVAQAKLSELADKVRLIESRALALEGTYTRLPADQQVIQQIEAAGIATLQETATTISARFASIKMTLLSIHGAFAVRSVQQLSDRQAKLDRQLTELRGRALKDVAVRAAAAPGENRLAQARQIEGVIAATREVNGLVAAAKARTDENFEAARQRFAAARQALAELQAQSGAATQPSAASAPRPAP